MKSLKRKTRGDVYRNAKKIIDDAIAVIPWMTADSLRRAERIHKQKIIIKETVVLQLLGASCL